MKHNRTLLAGALAAVFALAACQQQVQNNAASGAAAPAPAASGASGASGAAPAASGAAAPAGLDTEAKQVSYLIGYELGKSPVVAELKSNGVEIDTKVLAEAIAESLDGKPSKISEQQAQQLSESLSKKAAEVAEKKAGEAKAAGEKFLEENKGKEGVKTTASGLQYKVNKEGSGAQAAKGDVVSVEYEGRLTNGEVFDTNKGQDAFAVPLVDNTVIQGWIEGLQLMKEGGEYTLYIPANLAYGERAPSPKIPANSVLVFDIKVNKVEKGAAKKLLQGMQQQQQQ